MFVAIAMHVCNYNQYSQIDRLYSLPAYTELDVVLLAYREIPLSIYTYSLAIYVIVYPHTHAQTLVIKISCICHFNLYRIMLLV